MGRTKKAEICIRVQTPAIYCMKIIVEFDFYASARLLRLLLRKKSDPIDKKQYIRYDNTVHEHGIIP